MAENFINAALSKSWIEAQHLPTSCRFWDKRETENSSYETCVQGNTGSEKNGIYHPRSLPSYFNSPIICYIYLYFTMLCYYFLISCYFSLSLYEERCCRRDVWNISFGNLAEAECSSVSVVTRLGTWQQGFNSRQKQRFLRPALWPMRPPIQ
jgi:hypothetical protein